MSDPVGDLMPDAPETGNAAADAIIGVATKAFPGLVRWKFLAVGAVGFVGFLFAGVGPIARAAVERAVEKVVGAPVTVESVSFNPITATLTLRGVDARDPKDPSRSILAAEEVVASLDRLGCLRGQIAIAELAIKRGKLRLVRNDDGTFNVQHAPGAGGGGPGGTTPPGMPPAPPAEEKSAFEEWLEKAKKKARETDWVETAKKWLERLEELQRERERQQKAPPPAPSAGDPDARAEWVFGRRPLVYVRSIRGEDLLVEIEDRSTEKPETTRITDGKLEAREVSTDPEIHAAPIEFEVTGKVDGKQVSITGKIDMRAQGGASKVRVYGAVPAAALDRLWRNTIPVALAGSTFIDLDIPVEIEDFRIDTRPKLALNAIQAFAREPGARLPSLGMTTDQLARGLTQVKKIALEDLRVFGKVTSPDVELGSTLKTLVVEALKAMGEELIDEATAKAKALADEQLLRATRQAEAAAAKALGREGGDAARRALGGFGIPLPGGTETGPGSGPPPPPPGPSTEKDRKKEKSESPVDDLFKKGEDLLPFSRPK